MRNPQTNGRNGDAWRRFLAAMLLFSISFAQETPAIQMPRIEVVPRADAVDVRIDGRPFTSLIWKEEVKKPVLFPVYHAGGAAVTRHYPLVAKVGERVDHPHHVGIWFNHGDVNGYAFWNNSPGQNEKRPGHYGSIHLVSIDEMKSGDTQGELAVTMEWRDPEGQALLREHTRFLFEGGEGYRGITRITRLKALDQGVLFKDNKEGVVAIRVTRVMEQPEEKAIRVSGADGKPLEALVLDNTGVKGLYRSSEGLTGHAVWGTRGRWMSLDSEIGGEPVSIVMLDHPANAGYPTYWHARGYGLFAANPLGNEVFSKGAEQLHLRLEPGAVTTFRHKLLFFNGEKPSEAAIDAAFDAFGKAD